MYLYFLPNIKVFHSICRTKLAYGLLSGKYSKESPVNTDLKEPTIIVSSV